MMPSKSEIVAKLKKRRILESLLKCKRIDGRGLTDYRDIKINVGIIEKAEGSAEVYLGDTRVISGVKIEVGEPYPDTPDEGVLIVNAELVPLASPTFEPGPPDENAIELARVVDRGLRSSHVIDFKKLCLIPGKKVILVYIDLYVLNHDGNLIDASALSALSALMNTKMVKFKIAGDEVVPTSEYRKLEVEDYPITVTFAKIGDVLVTDPSLEEEEIMDARLSIALNKNGEICAIQKGSSGTLTLSDIEKALKVAKEKAEEIRKILMEAVYGKEEEEESGGPPGN